MQGKWTISFHLCFETPISHRSVTLFSFLHSLHILANLELSSFTHYYKRTKGFTSVWPLKYWTKAPPELLAAVITWNVRPCCLLQCNLNWVKGISFLSSFIALAVSTALSLLVWLIPRCNTSTERRGRDDILWITMLETRTQPPEMMKQCSDYSSRLRG